MQKTKGFTLIELLIAMVIIGILVVLVYPSYHEQVVKTRRTDGQSALMVAAQSLERCYSEFNAYNNANCTFSATSGEGYYSIGGTLTASTFILKATAIGNQTNDTKCTSLSIDQTNLRTATGSSPSECW
ncbi:MAG: prepilin-type N-terminal cleavage/methylation domain-containing protein [Gammaproteobacteria bacterium]|nr:prepilin-type N-terminal cleavage/methylation domain-containing protein [Gammaproteobacteria bacterium]